MTLNFVSQSWNLPVSLHLFVSLFIFILILWVSIIQVLFLVVEIKDEKSRTSQLNYTVIGETGNK